MSGFSSRSRIRNSASVGFVGWRIVRSSACAATFTGGGTSWERERPCAASGCVMTATTSNPSPTSARSEGTANSGVPKKATRTLQFARRLRRNLLQVSLLAFAGFLPLRQQQIALHRAEMIEKEYAIQMIDLVLNRAGLVARGLGADFLSLHIERLDHDARRPRDVAENIGNRQ